jgi:hypothetical protein
MRRSLDMYRTRLRAEGTRLNQEEIRERVLIPSGTVMGNDGEGDGPAQAVSSGFLRHSFLLMGA